MHHRTRTAPRAGRPCPSHGATRPPSGAAWIAALVLGLLLAPATAGAEPADPLGDDALPGSESSALSVSVSETPASVQLRIQASGDVEPGSLEIRFFGRKAVVLARDTAGRAIRSQPLRLPAAVVEDGASADYDEQEALVMTLRKQHAAQAAGPPPDRDASAR